MSAERNANDIELISTYLDGQLTGAERLAFENRLQNDSDLRRQVAEMRQTVALLKALPTLTAPRNFTLTPAMVRAKQPPRRITYTFSMLSAAAAILMIVVGFTLFSTQLGVGARQNTASSSDGSVALASPQQEVANLPTQAMTSATDETLAYRQAETQASLAPPTSPQNLTPTRLDEPESGSETAAELQIAQEPTTITSIAAPIISQTDTALDGIVESESDTASAGAAADETGPAAEESAPAESSDMMLPPASVFASTMQPTDEEVMEMFAAESTPTTAPTLQPSATPTVEPSPTAIPTPESVTPQPPSDNSSAATLGILLIGLGVVMLGAAGLAVVRSRRS